MVVSPLLGAWAVELQLYTEEPYGSDDGLHYAHGDGPPEDDGYTLTPRCRPLRILATDPEAMKEMQNDETLKSVFGGSSGSDKPGEFMRVYSYIIYWFCCCSTQAQVREAMMWIIGEGTQQNSWKKEFDHFVKEKRSTSSK